eukprot:TRINITY_DN3268_c0_g1_i1.p1 TRINITY_DN3268_c0_g1~~TRINITY_DN3268_c0_g1_i1.p1  ORF type:complete len:749 (-),score=176.43 TRINITY_DN3268_c0_g1_i1:23-2269(-)
MAKKRYYMAQQVLQIVLPSGVWMAKDDGGDGKMMIMDMVDHPNLVTVADLLQYLVTQFDLVESRNDLNIRTEQYFFLQQNYASVVWMNDETFVSEIDPKDSVFYFVRRYIPINFTIHLGTFKFKKRIIVDGLAPLSTCLPLVASQFQVPDYEDFIFFNKNVPLPPLFSIKDFQLLPESDITLRKKSDNLEEEEQTQTVFIEKSGILGSKDKKRKGNYFVMLKSGSLHIWAGNEPDDQNFIEALDDLQSYIVVDKSKKKEFVFELQHNEDEKKNRSFKAPSEYELNDWMRSLSNFEYTEEVKKNTVIYGQPIESAMKDGLPLPYIIHHCIEVIDNTALKEVGIFRLSGSAVTINEYKRQFDEGIDVDLSDEIDSHAVAGLLKLYFRELPEPIMTYQLYSSFLHAQSLQNEHQRRRNVRHLIKELPEVNRAIMKALMAFLGRVDEYREINKMAIHNLATVFAPNLLKPENSNPLQLVEDTPLVNGLVHTLITQYDYIFSEEDPEEDDVMAVAKFAYEATAEDQIDLAVGDEINILEQDDDGWWTGELVASGRSGKFPGSYVKLVPVGFNRILNLNKKISSTQEKVSVARKRIAALTLERNKIQEDIDILNALQSEGMGPYNESTAVAVGEVISKNKKLGNLYDELDTTTNYVASAFGSIIAYPFHTTDNTGKKIDLLQELNTQVNEFRKDLKASKDKKKFADAELVEELMDKMMDRFEELSVSKQNESNAYDKFLKDIMYLQGILKSGNQ